MIDDLAARLGSWIADQLGRPVELGDVRVLVGGASREIYGFTLEGRRLVLRRDPPGVPRVHVSPRGEFEAMRAAMSEGVPVPEPIFVCEDPAVLGSPFVVMGHLEGETIPRRILRDEAFAELRPRLAPECGRILARLHRAEIPEGVRRPRPGSDGASAELEFFEAQLDDLVDATGRHPALEFGLRWLRTHPVPVSGPVLVHGDFRLGNLMVGPEGVRGVLDWEIVHGGDPLEDLGWLCVRAWRFGHDEKAVGGFGTREDLAAAYEEESGRRVDMGHLRWWEIMGTLRWGIGCGVQTSKHLRGQVRNIELAALGRRIAEQEYDLLELIAGQG